jgi:glycosyltransferase involved in cell wall biosynthesis
MPASTVVDVSHLGTSPFRPCVLIPVYNHERTLVSLLDRLKLCGLPCLLVDDGSDVACRDTMVRLRQREAAWVRLVRHGTNEGKGAAVITGLRAAAAMGFTHAVQIDADAQHSADDVPKFLDAARRTPHAVIAGFPVYDISVPTARLYGRYATHVWVWINTLSLEIRDAMCGFRVYPIALTLALADRVRLGKRMEFDAEVIVRLYWEGVPVVNLPTPVTYRLDNVSHFRLWRDNLRISGKHARLFFGMLVRLPRLLLRRRSAV